MDFGIKFDIHSQLTLNDYMKIFEDKRSRLFFDF